MRTGTGQVRQELADQVRRERRRAFLVSNVLTPAVIGVLLLVLPFDAALWQRLLGVGLVGIVLVADQLGKRRRLSAWSDFIMLATRLAAAAVVAALVPTLWHAATVVTAALVGGAVFVETRGRVVLLALVSSGGLAAGALINEVDGWYLPLTIFIISVIAVEAWYREWNSERLEIERRHNELIDNAAMFAWEVDNETGVIVGLAGNIESVLGHEPDELIGLPASDVVSRSAMWETEGDGQSDRDQDSVVTARHRSGREVTLREVRLASKRGSDTRRGVSMDVTELAAVTRALRHQAQHDALTGLANRKLLEETMTDALTDGRSVSLVVADLDRFKEINDTLGHPVGDQLLCVLGERFSRDLAGVDLVARMGGDEFAFMIDNCDDAHRARGVANAIVRLAAAPLEVEGMSLAVSCSAGVAVAPIHGSTYAELLKHADIAAYDAKRSGGGAVVFKTTPDELSVRRLQLISQMAGALDRGEFELFFQPQVNLDTGEIAGVEGLARWRHPKLGLLTPGDFLAAMEVGSEYHRFTDEMLRQGITFAAASGAAGHATPVALNLGSISFLDQGLPGRVATLLRDHDVRPDLITLEVTESDLLDEAGADAPVFAALSRLGVRLSIDDFGTGYSNLTRLRALDVGEVKIDRGFVAGLESGTEDGIIVRAIVDLARLLGHSVVAEGVETAGQLERLQRIGCRVAQGFLFDRALPADEMVALLGAGHRYEVGGFGEAGAGGLVFDAEVPRGLLEARDDADVRSALAKLFSDLDRDDEPNRAVIVRDRADRFIDANAHFRNFHGDDAMRALVGRRVDRASAAAAFGASTRMQAQVVPLRNPAGRLVGSATMLGEYGVGTPDAPARAVRLLGEVDPVADL